MGASNSTAANDENANALNLAMRHFAGRSGYVGGGDAGYFGGADEDPAKGLREYAESLSAKTKEDFIRRLAAGLKLAGIPVNPEADVDDILKALTENIPHPKKTGKSFGQTAQSQEKVCRVVARVLNDQFTPGETKPEKMFIDTSLGAEAVCRQLSDWAHTFMRGVNVEFLAVHASVKNLVRSIEVLDQIMRELHSKIEARVADAKDPSLSRDLETFTEVYNRAQGERQRQLETLKNILNIQLAPAAKELEMALRDESAERAMIARLGLKPGTNDFANALAMAVSGLGTAGVVASRVDKALKRVGLTIQEYVNSPDYKAFVELLDRKVESGQVKAAELAEFIKATSLLRQGFADRKEIAKQLERGAEAVGGADEDDPTRSTIDKRVEKSKSERKIIIRDFVQRMSRHYDDILSALKALGPQLGKKIPITEKTDVLRDALVRLQNMRQNRIELALVGLYTDAAARERKESFITSLRQVSAACADLMGTQMFHDASPYLARLKEAIDGLEKTVDYFSDVITKKFGGKNGGDEADLEGMFEGGAAGGAGEEADLLPEISRNAVSLNDAVNDFNYFYYIAKFRTNLDQSSKELEAFGEKYTSLLGDAVAERVHKLGGEKTTILTALAAALAAELAAAAAGHRAPVPSEAQFAEAKKWVEAEFDAKNKLYRALQAMDLYMKAFTSGIAANPDDVLDIKKMLDGTDVIARWFNESTGDSLWKAFEHMSSPDFGGNKTAPGTANLASTLILADGTNKHYYEKVGAVPADGDQVGVPQLGVLPGPGVGAGALALDHAAAAKKSISDTLEYFQALKNLVTAFARMGDKFGGREISGQVFMSPNQIYKALMDYLKQSALSVHTRAAPGAAVAPIAVNVAGRAVGRGVNPYEVYFGSTLANLGGGYEREDRYFALMIKGMAAKILTTLGTYDILNRRTPIYELTPTRMIIGGGPEDEVDVVEGALELYFRLPRLAEFYHQLLRWEGEAGTGPLKIAMLPELEGVFSGLIRLIFLKMASSGPETGDYSDTEMRSVIAEINTIYLHFKEKKADGAVSAAINGLVMEVNRRYGIVKQEDMSKYWEMIRLARKGTFGDTNDTNYAILPDEGETEVERRAPSDQFVVPGTAAAALDPFRGRITLDDDINAAQARRMLLREFRGKIEKEFALVSRDSFGKTSFALLIKQAEAELRRATTKEARVAVAQKLIQSTTVVSIDASKGFMFHETAVTALNVLNAMTQLLKSYSDAIDQLNIFATVADKVYDHIRGGAAAPAAPGGFTPAMVAGIAGIDVRLLYALADVPVRGDLDVATTGQDFYELIRQRWGGVNAVVLPAGKTISKMSESDITGLGAARLPDQRNIRAVKLFARGVINYREIMKEFIENVFALQGTFNGLVEVRFPQAAQTPIQLNFSKLRATAESLLSDAKHYMDLFRPYIDKDVFKRFEELTSAGSVFWLEQNLVDARFRGASEAEADRAQTLDGISRRTTQLFRTLTENTGVPFTAAVTRLDLQAGNDAAIIEPTDANAAACIEEFGNVIAELTWYDTNAGLAGLAGASADLNVGYDLGVLIRELRLPPAAPAVPTSAGAGALGRFQLFTDNDSMTRHRSLMFAFNQVLSRYLSVLSDPSGSRKIYFNLINAFANGVASRAVSTPNGNTFPDLADAGTAFGHRGDPAHGSVLVTSLAYVLRFLIKDINPQNQIAEHLVSTLTDVPLYLKESYRANLPGFIRLFELIVQKGEFIKQLIQKTTINCGRRIRVAGGGGAPAAPNANHYPRNGLDALEAFAAITASDALKAKFVEIVDAVSSGAYTLATSAGEVLKELGDQPVYLQTHEGSIETYKSRYGKLPLMPLSLILYFLNDLGPAVGRAVAYDDKKLFPRTTLGEPDFKLQYGVRGIIVKQLPVTFEAMPGVKAALDSYNSVTAKREQIDSDRYLSFAKNVVLAMRYITESRNYKSALSTSRYVFSFASLITIPPAVGSGLVLHTENVPGGNTVFAVGKPIQRVITVVESSAQDDEANKMIDVVGRGAPVGAASGRQRERIENIIDMNLMPINVHALMRDTPVANLFNYEYTLEQMACAIFGESSNQFTEGTINDASTQNTRQMFLRLLVNPYMDVSQAMYGSDVQDLGTGGFVHRIFRGDNSLGMGRPKMLSDQLFNKALFGNVYQAQVDYDEAGPGVGSGIARGRDTIGNVGIRFKEYIINGVAAYKKFVAFVLKTAQDGAGAGVNIDAPPGDAQANAALVRVADEVERLARVVVSTYVAAIGVLATIAGILAGGLPVYPISAAYHAEVLAILPNAGAGGNLQINSNLRDVVRWAAAAGGRTPADMRFILNGVRGVGVVAARCTPARHEALLAGLVVGGVNRNLNDVAMEMAAVRGTASNTPARHRNQRLTFMKDDGSIEEIDVQSAGARAHLEEIGRMRFDTRLVRNMFFIVNVLRLVRLKLNRELTQSRSVLVNSHAAVAPGLTEYGHDPFTPNETYGSSIRPNVGRYNDQETF